MIRRQLFLGLILAIGLSQQTFAEAIVEVRVGIDGGAGHDASTSGDPAFAGAKVVSGSAHIDANGGFAEVNLGPFPECPLCGQQGPPGGSAFTRAEANGNAGVLRGLARSSAAATTPAKFAGAIAALTDTIKFIGTPIVNFDIDLFPTLTGEGFTSLLFKFGLKGGGPCAEGACEDSVLAQLLVDHTRDTLNNSNRRFYERS